MSKIIIFTEGGFHLGLGHVYRTLSLAQNLSNFGKEVIFITSSEMYVCDLIKNKNFMVVKCINEANVKEEIFRLKPNVLIIDKLHIEESFTRDLRPVIPKIVIFGNISSANKYSDIVINAIIGTNYENRSAKDSFGTHYFCGPKYLVLRDEFYEKSGKYQYSGKLNRILLTFGGSDQANFSEKILVNLLKSNKFDQIKILLGAGYKCQGSLEKVLQINKTQKIDVLTNVKDVSTHMINSDLIFTSPGTTLFESFLLKVPVISFFQNESQKEVFGKFYCTHDFEDNENLYLFANSFFHNYDNYFLKLRDIQTGEGKTEIIYRIVEEI